MAGDGNSLSSYRITDSPPDGDGPIQAMRQALWSAGATPADVDYLNAHGTSTGMNDRSESAAIKVVFGADVPRLSVSSTKSTMGHLIAAAGAVEVAVCALAIRDGLMPINSNLREVDPDCDLNFVRDAPRRRRVRMAMSNSFGFGGSNSCIVLRHPDETDALTARETAVGPSKGADASPPRRQRSSLSSLLQAGELSRIVITATGAVCSGGKSPRDILAGVRAGTSTIAPIQQWDVSGWPTTMAGEIADFNAREMVDDRKLHKLIRRTDLLGLYAAGKAIGEAGLAAHRDTLAPEAAATFSDRTGVYVGSGSGNFENQYDYFPLLAAADGSLPKFGRELANTVNPMWLLRSLPNNVLGHIGIKYGLKGSNACITSHSCSGTLAVIEAMEALRNGEADRIVAVGHDAPIEPQMVLYYYRLGWLIVGSAAPLRHRARRQRLRRRRRRSGAGTGKASAAARNAKVLGHVLGGRSLGGDGTFGQSATTATASPARLAWRWTMPESAPPMSA